MAEAQSDLNTDSEEKKNRHKRARKVDPLYISTNRGPSFSKISSEESSEEEEMQNSLSAKMPEYPTPPKQRKISVMSNSSEESVRLNSTPTSSKVEQTPPPKSSQQGMVSFVIYQS